VESVQSIETSRPARVICRVIRIARTCSYNTKL
jgi:hypothetical protein